MFKSFNISAAFKGISWTSAQSLVRAALGTLLLANILAAGFAFHWWGDSPISLESKIEDTRRQIGAALTQLNRAKAVASKLTLASAQGGTFLSMYMTPRKGTYSTILSELNHMAATAGVKMKDTTFSYEPVEGSASLSQLTITSGYEAPYQNLIKFVNLLDRSPRFLIIENMQATPQPTTGVLQVVIKLDTFVRDDVESQL